MRFKEEWTSTVVEAGQAGPDLLILRYMRSFALLTGARIAYLRAGQGRADTNDESQPTLISDQLSKQLIVQCTQ